MARHPYKPSIHLQISLWCGKKWAQRLWCDHESHPNHAAYPFPHASNYSLGEYCRTVCTDLSFQGCMLSLFHSRYSRWSKRPTSTADSRPVLPLSLQTLCLPPTQLGDDCLVLRELVWELDRCNSDQGYSLHTLLHHTSSHCRLFSR